MASSLWTPIVRSIIRRSIGAGWSGRRIYSALPDWGLPSYHRTDFFNIVRYEREFLRVGKPTVDAPSDVRFPRNIMVEEEFDADFRYRIHGKMTYYDAVTDQEIQTDIQMYSDDNLGKDGWQDDFIGRYSKRYEDEEIEIISVSFDKIVHQPGYRY